MSFTPQMSAYARACSKCKRRTQVEVPQFGISHVMDVMTTCWDCLDPKQREQAKKLYGITESVFDEDEVRRAAAQQQP